MLEGRSMVSNEKYNCCLLEKATDISIVAPQGQFIILPDGRLFHLNGIATGTAGYGNTS
jgi:hypothetical protein